MVKFLIFTLVIKMCLFCIGATYFQILPCNVLSAYCVPHYAIVFVRKIQDPCVCVCTWNVHRITYCLCMIWEENTTFGILHRVLKSRFGYVFGYILLSLLNYLGNSVPPSYYRQASQKRRELSILCLMIRNT